MGAEFEEAGEVMARNRAHPIQQAAGRSPGDRLTLRVPGALGVATRETALARRETSKKRARVLLS